MKDLVSQLVGALNRLYVAAPTGLECNSFHHSKGEFHSHSEPCKPAAEYVEALAQARSALTAAKAGGWVAVPAEPTVEMIHEVEHASRLGAVWTAASVYKAMLAARPLPTPPKEQACPPAPATPAMSAQARPRALLLGALSLEST